MRSGGAFWKASVHTLGVSSASVILGLLTSIVLARALGPEGKGHYDLVMATAGLLTVALGLALPAGATYAIAAGRSAAGPLFRALLIVAAGQGVAAMLAVAAIRTTPLGPAFVTPSLPATVPVAVGVLVSVTAAGLYARAVLMGHERIIEANWRDLFGRIATALLVAVGALASQGRASPADAAFLVICAGIVGAAVALGGYVQGALPHLRSRGSAGIPAVAQFALPSALANLVQFLNYRMDLFLVGLFLGPTQVGLYALAASVAQLIWLVSRSGASVLLPRVAATAEVEWDAAVHHSAVVARLTFAVSVVAGIALALASGLAVPLVYGDRFSGSIAPILWLLPGIVIFAPVNVIGAFMAGIGQPRMNLTVSVVSFAVTLALDLALIPGAGIVGAAMASTASYATAAAVMFTTFSRRTGLAPLQLLVLRPEDVRELTILVREPHR